MSSKENMERQARNLASKKSESVRVIVRVRPLKESEINEGREAGICKVDKAARSITIKNPEADRREQGRAYTFDNVYGMDSKQKDIYDETAAPIVDGVLQGYNGTIFAYGQTGAGKTFTMEGVANEPHLRGIMPNAFRHIFQAIAANKEEGKQFLVSASYLEIYQEKVRDLLGKDPTKTLSVKQDMDGGFKTQGKYSKANAIPQNVVCNYR